MVREPPLRKVVRADAVASVAAADQALACRGFLRRTLAAFLLVNAGGEHLKRLRLVAVL